MDAGEYYLGEMKVAQSGLMRCCTDSIAKLYAEKGNIRMREDDTIVCVHENKPTMRVVHGVIRWIGAVR